MNKTELIARLLSDPYQTLLFPRPRRFGKTTFLSLLEHYYDVARKDRFEELFSGLYAFDHPTPERHRYLVLRLDFSGLGLDEGPTAASRDQRDAGAFESFQQIPLPLEEAPD